MAYRFSNTDKWRDAWFSELKPIEKLLFLYLCDNCDIAGFIELTPRKWAFDIGLNQSDILGALKGLGRGLIYSHSGDCIFLRNFLKHQKNLPLNEKNNAHNGIIKRFEYYKLKFNIENIENFINQEVKPLARGYGNGKGNDSGKGNGKKSEENSNKFIPPQISEVIDYFTEKGYSKQAAEKMFEYYSVADWKDSKGNKIRNWKQKANAVWFKDEHKSNTIDYSDKTKWAKQPNGYYVSVDTFDPITKQAYLERISK